MDRERTVSRGGWSGRVLGELNVEGPSDIEVMMSSVVSVAP